VRSVTKLAIRKKLSQLLAGILIGSLFPILPGIFVPGMFSTASANYQINCSGGGSFTSSGTTITSRSGSGCKGSVTIPEGIVTIATNGFYDAFDLRTVVFPSTLTTVGEWAFGNVPLTSLTLNEGLVTLGFAAFWGNRVTTLVLPNSLTSLSNDAAFGNNPFMQNLTLGSGLTNLGARTFESNSGLLSLTIPSGATSIGSNAFLGFAQSSYNYCGTSLTQTALNNAGLTGKTKTCLQTQTINRTSTSPTSPVVSGTYTPTATASSSLTVAITIASGSSSVCSISSGLVTFNAVGSCVIQYNQSGNASYSAAAQVTESLTIGKATPTFGSWSNVSKTVGDSPFTTAPSVTGSIPGNFSYSSATTSVISVSGSTLTVVGVGSSVIEATFTPSNTTNYNTAKTTMTVTVAASGVSTLSNLILSSVTLNPTFSSGTTSYTASVANSVTSTTVTPTRTQANATITVNGTSVNSGSASGAISLSVGSNPINVVVTAQNGTTSTYTVTVTRAATIPGAPTGVSGTVDNASSVVSWSAPGSNGGSAITGYTVTSSPAVAAPASCTNTTNLSCTFTGLTNGTSYTFSVIAINAAGNSSAGTSSSVTPRTVPGAPTGVSGTIDYESSVVSWSAPGSNGGSAITGYTVTSSPGGLNCTTTSTSCRVSGLTEGLTYTFIVVATNAAGNSLASNASAGVTPLKPFYVYCKNSNGVDQTITVSAVVSANSLSSCFGIVTLGAGITRLSGSTFLTAAQQVNMLSNPTYPADFNTGVTGIVFPEGFTTLDAYSLAGLGALSSLAFPNSLAPIPAFTFLRSNIKTLDFSAFLGNYGSFTISASAFSYAERPQWWRDCSAGGGVPTNGYLFDYLALRGGTAYCAPTTVATLSSLTPSSGILQTQFVSSTFAYNLSVANSVTSINFTTTLTDSRASVYVNKIPQTNGSRNTFTGGVPNSISLGAGTTEISIVVIAQDGTTQVNYTVSVTRLAFEVPGAPTGVSGIVANTSSVVSWTAPGSNGGSAITGYTVTSSPGGFTCTTTTTSCTVNGLTNGTSYTFRVIATNAAGNSVPSTASASVTPRSSDATLSASSIKGQSTTLGTPNELLTSVTAGTITLTTAQATGVDTTTFTKTDAGATISRIVKYASDASTTNSCD
jgi:hypothetical protein